MRHDKPPQSSPELSSTRSSDYEQNSGDTIGTAVDHYIHTRAFIIKVYEGGRRRVSDINELRYSIDHQLNDYIRRQIRSNQEKIEPLNERPANTGMTICVPVAIQSETPETIERLMQQIATASAGVEGGVNVIIWANAKTTPTQKQFIQEQCKPLYNHLRQQLTPFDSNTVTINTAFEAIDTDSFILSTIRGNFMETVIARLMNGEIDIDHPVLWLDADTTRIRPKTLRAVQQDIKERPFGFCHPDIAFSLEWLEGISPHDWDPYSRLLFVDEMAQRAFNRVACLQGNVPTPINDRVYAEESGLAFPISTYLASGGLRQKDRMGESALLQRRYQQHGAGFFDRLARSEADNPYLYDVRWLDATGVGIEMSARRIHRLLQEQPTEEVDFSRTFANDYVLATEQEAPPDDQVVDTSRMEALARTILTRKRGTSSETLQQDTRKRVERMLRNRVLGFNLPEKFFNID